MKTIPIYIRVINPEGKKVSVIQRVNERSQAPIGDAFFNLLKARKTAINISYAGRGLGNYEK